MVNNNHIDEDGNYVIKELLLTVIDLTINRKLLTYDENSKF